MGILEDIVQLQTTLAGNLAQLEARVNAAVAARLFGIRMFIWSSPINWGVAASPQFIGEDQMNILIPKSLAATAAFTRASSCARLPASVVCSWTISSRIPMINSSLYVN